MRIAVIGGKLQGVEIVYLARKAGWETVLFDKTDNVPASGLCDEFIHTDISSYPGLKEVFKNVDLVIPATENRDTLDFLFKYCRDVGVPFAFDPAAFAISSSKQVSDRLFGRLGLPAPRPWPYCDFPVLIKPDSDSGSRGVRLCETREELESLYPGGTPDDAILQEYVEGPSYSLEICGTPGNYRTFTVTGLEMDNEYDCRRVFAPTDLDGDLIRAFEYHSLHLAEAVKLKGLMDVEVILHRRELKVLEIDARFPSQTPTAVYWSTGINLLEQLASVFLACPLSSVSTSSRAVIYEHIRVTGEAVEFPGEHIIADAGPLHIEKDFFGVPEALTNYSPDRSHWVATLIFPAPTLKSAFTLRQEALKKIPPKPPGEIPKSPGSASPKRPNARSRDLAPQAPLQEKKS